MNFYRSFITLWLWAMVAFCALAQPVNQGLVFDAQTKEPLPGVTLAFPDGKGAITDANGHFSRTNTVTKVIVSAVGYRKQEVSLALGQPIRIALEPAVEDLQTVVVTGNREAALRTETPIAISKLSAKLINETKPTSIYEVINKTPGVLMVNLNNEQHMMAIRQPMTTNAYFLYMEDGVPIRPMGVFNHNALLEMNQFTVSSIEVVKGPVSSIYGPEAVGGAVNFITQRPTAVPTARVGIQADQWGYQRIQFGAGATQGKFGIYVGGFVSRQRNSNTHLIPEPA
jgi:iron complex outermembrane receptor protein